MTQPEILSTISNTSLFIISGILTGVIFAPIIAYFGQLFERHDAFIKTNFFLRTTWILAGIFAIVLLCLLLFYPSSDSKSSNPALALAPLGMMIAALIASASVMKNIAETKANEDLKYKNDEEKSQKEKDRKRIFTTKVIKSISKNLSSIYKKTQPNNSNKINHTRKHYESDIQTIMTLLNSIFCESILPFLTDDDQNTISDFYSDFYNFISSLGNDLNGSFSNQELIDFRESIKKFIEITKSYTQEKES
jgi:preprotein translocase subunit SecG